MESFHSLDVNGNNTLEYDEFSVDINSERIFKMLDLNSNNHVDQEEIQKVLYLLHPNSTKNDDSLVTPTPVQKTTVEKLVTPTPVQETTVEKNKIMGKEDVIASHNHN